MSTLSGWSSKHDLSQLAHSWSAPKCTEPLWTVQEQGHTCIFPATMSLQIHTEATALCGLPLSVVS